MFKNGLKKKTKPVRATITTTPPRCRTPLRGALPCFLIAVCACLVALAHPRASAAAATATRPSDWELNASTTTVPSRRVRTKPLVIVAGLSRTGTSSLQGALLELNLTVHHTYETMNHHLDFWYFYLNGQITKPDVAALIDPLQVDALSDCWFAYLAPELLEAYPDAKVILTTRDKAAWIRSYKAYIESSDLYRPRAQLVRLALARVSRLLGLGAFLQNAKLVQKAGGLDLEKLPLVMDVWQRIDAVMFGTSEPSQIWEVAYERHNAFIRSLVPPAQLLEFDLSKGDGYAELVDFLKVDPDVAKKALASQFPRINCIPNATCVSHISEHLTKTHERYAAAAAATILTALTLALYACSAALRAVDQDPHLD